jgi:hypothetical protein
VAARCVVDVTRQLSGSALTGSQGVYLRNASILIQQGSTPDAWHDKGFGRVLKSHVESPILRCTHLSGKRNSGHSSSVVWVAARGARGARPGCHCFFGNEIGW